MQSILEGSAAIHTTMNKNRIIVNPVDRPIIATAEDAILAKQATVQAGYYQDPFLEPFCQRAVGVTATATVTSSSHNRQQQQRRQVQPIIKRGTHARVCVMDRAIGAFLELHSSSSSSSSPCQIVVLGAGKDTSFFRYRAGLLNYDNINIPPATSNNHNSQQQKVHWYEVDQPSVIQEKAKTIEETPFLLSSPSPSSSNSLHPTPHGFRLVQDNNNDNLSTSSSLTYTLVSHDLRDPPNQLFQKLALDTTLPTLYLLECVLMYLPNDASCTLLQALNDSARHVWVACYEPILQNDPFGTMMQQNLVKARVALPDSVLLQTRTLTDQLTKLISSNVDSSSNANTTSSFGTATGCDMWSAYETIVTKEQRQRANQCEFLDEVEEWMLIMRHYAFVVACGGTTTCTNDDDYSRIGPGSLLGFVSGKCQRLQKYR